MFTYGVEKSIIAASLLAAFPLFLLDKNLHGSRRFAWLVAMISGSVTLLFLNPMDNLIALLDKVTMAAISISSVPHFLRLIKDSPWFGLSTIPPIFVVIHMSLNTQVDSEAYWRLRAFLHMAVFIIPYLNHLPAEESTKSFEEYKLYVGKDERQKSMKCAVGFSPSKSKKTAKHKGGKSKNLQKGSG